MRGPLCRRQRRLSDPWADANTSDTDFTELLCTRSSGHRHDVQRPLDGFHQFRNAADIDHTRHKYTVCAGRAIHPCALRYRFESRLRLAYCKEVDIRARIDDQVATSSHRGLTRSANAIGLFFGREQRLSITSRRVLNIDSGYTY